MRQLLHSPVEHLREAITAGPIGLEHVGAPRAGGHHDLEDPIVLEVADGERLERGLVARVHTVGNGDHVGGLDGRGPAWQLLAGDRVEHVHDTVHVGVRDLQPPQPTDVGGVVDLMAALEESLQRSRDDRHAAASGNGSYTDLTRDELYDLAQQRDVSGRSSMSKDELVDALRETDIRAGAA